MTNTFLIDTHVLLWFDVSPEQIPQGSRDRLRRPENQVVVSSITAWELTVKHRLGRLPEASALLSNYHALLAQYGFTELPFTSVHGLREASLSSDHKDPFDRALVAQALSEQIPIISRDSEIATFSEVQTFWQ